MPFTPAHVAAILPFARRPWVIPALVAGSIAPDMPYFARALPVTVRADSWYEPFVNATVSHSVIGAATVALPYAVLLTALWWIARRPLISVFTTTVQSYPRDKERASGLLMYLAWLIASALVGIATHLIWDAATHPLRALQHISTAAGLLILIVVLVRHRASLQQLRSRTVIAVLLLGGIVASAGAVFQRRNDPTSTIEHMLRAGAEAAGVAGGVALAVIVAGWWLRRAVIKAPSLRE